MNWFNKYWKVILIGLNIPIALIFGVLFWKIIFDNEISTLSDFNNLSTPIVSFLSVIGVVITLVYLHIQNKVILSQSVKTNLEYEYDVLKIKLGQSLSNSIYSNVGYYFPNDKNAGKDFEDITSLNFIEKLREAIAEVMASQDYLDDLDNKTIRRLPVYFYQRNYSRKLRFIIAHYHFPTMKFNLIEDFLEDVKFSELSVTDKRYFARKVEINFIEEYFKFYQHETFFDIPNIHDRDEENKVKWGTYKDSGIGRFYPSLNSLVRELKNLS